MQHGGVAVAPLFLTTRFVNGSVGLRSPGLFGVSSCSSTIRVIAVAFRCTSLGSVFCGIRYRSSGCIRLSTQFFSHGRGVLSARLLCFGVVFVTAEHATCGFDGGTFRCISSGFFARRFRRGTYWSLSVSQGIFTCRGDLVYIGHGSPRSIDGASCNQPSRCYFERVWNCSLWLGVLLVSGGHRIFRRICVHASCLASGFQPGCYRLC